jgi:predicted RNA binding protein YcfA (HicA-like mRNA interferase family)
VKGYADEVREKLKEAGWTFHRHGKGSHDIWISPTGQTITVPTNLKVRHTANGILKQAGLPKAF